MKSNSLIGREPTLSTLTSPHKSTGGASRSRIRTTLPQSRLASLGPHFRMACHPVSGGAAVRGTLVLLPVSSSLEQRTQIGVPLMCESVSVPQYTHFPMTSPPVSRHVLQRIKTVELAFTSYENQSNFTPESGSSQQRPDDSCFFVCDRDTSLGCSQPALFMRDPAAAAIRFRPASINHRPSAMNEQHAQIRDRRAS